MTFLFTKIVFKAVRLAFYLILNIHIFIYNYPFFSGMMHRDGSVFSTVTMEDIKNPDAMYRALGTYVHHRLEIIKLIYLRLIIFMMACSARLYHCLVTLLTGIQGFLIYSITTLIQYATCLPLSRCKDGCWNALQGYSHH